MKQFLFVGLGILLLGALIWTWQTSRPTPSGETLSPSPANAETAYFAGGCFWCTEADFEKLAGVIEAVSGYSGGTTAEPTYEQVSSHTTGHIETVEVRYDPSLVSYERLVRYHFAHIDPTDANGQFVDRGESYVSAVFYQSEAEKETALSEVKRLSAASVYPKPIVTAIRPFERFWPAEGYHQDYWQENPLRYTYYRNNSGRDQYLERACGWREAKGIDCEKGGVK